ncbi:hypothetical protein [Lentilactobacillus sp. Marseille-Q4993]|uniref:hypothetical protein n=1 Tax=Lentilactobacillus sp. Marseille-Q4993 TaxID=3039492 RepID=UPI0024BBFF2A|nr:hypothetical protein [Lentilactobacillus sp. Marseille-Q4993]
MKITTKLTATLLLAFAFGGTTITQAKTAKFNINSIQNPFTKTYYRTNRVIKIPVMLVNTANKERVHKTLTIPKGTIVAAKMNTYWNSKIHKNNDYRVDYYGDSLSYKIRKTVLTKGLRFYDSGLGSQDVKYHKGQLTKVSRPGYELPYSFGDLQYGSLPKLSKLNVPAKYSDKLQITSDGYLEYYKANPKLVDVNAYLGEYPNKPVSIAKITATKQKGDSRYLYTKTHVKGVSDKHIRKTGSYRYRLRITNLHKPTDRYSYTDGDYYMSEWFSTYSIGGKKAYTQIGTDGGD